MKEAVHFAGSFYQIDEMIIDVSQITFISPKYAASMFVLLKGSVDEFHLDPSHYDPIRAALLDYQNKGAVSDRATSCN